MISSIEKSFGLALSTLAASDFMDPCLEGGCSGGCGCGCAAASAGFAFNEDASEDVLEVDEVRDRRP